MTTFKMYKSTGEEDLFVSVSQRAIETTGC